MSLFEKIECEPIDVENRESHLPRSSRRWKDETFSVTYLPGKKLLVLFYALIFALMFAQFMEEGFFGIEVLVVTSLAVGAFYLWDCLFTRSFTFSPDCIVKSSAFGKQSLSTDGLVMAVNEQRVRFAYGSTKNARESFNVYRTLITEEQTGDLLQYALDVYGIVPIPSGKESRSMEGAPHQLGVQSFESAVLSYWTISCFFVVWLLVAFFTVGVSDNFTGYAHVLPTYPVRLTCIALALLAYLILRLVESGRTRSGGLREVVSIEGRLQQVERDALVCSIVSAAVGVLGLLLFLLFANSLDLYIFSAAGLVYLWEHFPRLSIWEGIARGAKAGSKEGQPGALINRPRRSLQVSLVLMGALAVMSYGEQRHFLYSTRQDCVDDWGDGKDCQDQEYVHGHYYHYHSGGSWGGGQIGRSPTRAVGMATVTRGGFGSLGGVHASFGG